MSWDLINPERLLGGLSFAKPVMGFFGQGGGQLSARPLQRAGSRKAPWSAPVYRRTEIKAKATVFSPCSHSDCLFQSFPASWEGPWVMGQPELVDVNLDARSRVCFKPPHPKNWQDPIEVKCNLSHLPSTQRSGGGWWQSAVFAEQVRNLDRSLDCRARLYDILSQFLMVFFFPL